MSTAALRDMLAHDNPEVRGAAASAVGRKKESALLPEVTALLADPEPAVAEAAQDALQSLRAPESSSDGEPGA